MKKFLLSLLAAVATIAAPAAIKGTAVAFDAQAPDFEELNESRASGYQIKYCGKISTYYTVRTTRVEVYVYVTPEMATQLVGNRVNRVTMSAVIQSASTLPGSAFVMERDENGDLVKVCESAASIRNSYNQPLPYQNLNLTTPYEIKANTGFYFGYSVTGLDPQNDYPIGVDAGPAAAPGFAGIIDAYNADVYQYTFDAAADFECNVFCYAQTVGDVTELNDLASINSIGSGGFTLPVMTGGANSTIEADIQNMGDNDIKSFEYTYGFNGGEQTAPVAIEVSIPSRTSKTVKLPVEGMPSGRSTIEVTLTKVNEASANISANCAALVLTSAGFPRRFVVEEATSVNCGYCPVGIVGMDYMAERYPDKFLGIAVHSNFNGADPMQIAGYVPWLNTYVESFPSCVINRDPKYTGQYPSSSELDRLYKVWRNQASPVNIEFAKVKVNQEAKTVEVTMKSTFALDQDGANFGYFFTLLEDDVFGLQLNYYAGGSNGAMGGWESKPNRAEWFYTDVPRSVEGLWGIPESIPSTIVDGEHYEYTATIPLGAVTDVNKMKIVAAVLDLPTGVILNANEVAYTGDFENGITDTLSGKSVKVAGANGRIDIEGEYSRVAVSNLAGQAVGRTTNLAPGIYVVNVDGRAFKVVVK